MIYVEDLIERLACSGNFCFCPVILMSSFDNNIVNSFSNQIFLGYPFTKKQRDLCLKLISKYKKSLSKEMGLDISDYLKSPSFRIPERIISNAKNIEVTTDASGVKKILVRFPYDNELVEKIKKHRKESLKINATLIVWNGQDRHWEFGLTEENILFLSTLISSGFTVDETFYNFLKEIQDVSDSIDNYIPMVVFQEDHFSFINVSTNVPALHSFSVIEALIKSRQYGISCWDDNVDVLLNSGIYKDVVPKFFKNGLDHETSVSLLDIQELIKFSDNILFVIPGGTEFKLVKHIHQFLKNQGTTSEEISVLFRLDNSLGKVFNEYVKEHSLNQPITEKTKYMFISGKLPKPLVESNKYFDLVIQFGLNSAHYGLKNYVKNHHNLIVMNFSNEQREFNFA